MALSLEGFASLALAYFAVDPLPPELVEIPLEYFAKAIAWLKTQPTVHADSIAVLGVSKGGELALLLGATYPEDLKAVVAYAPSAVVYQGLSRGWRHRLRSSWTLGDEPVPFVRVQPSIFEVIRFFARRPVSFRLAYERPLNDCVAVAAGSIAVEKIGGPVLLVSGTDDRVWPSTLLSEMVIDRLGANDHPFPYEHLRYEGAGHQIGAPGADETPFGREFGPFVLGGSTETNRAASVDSWPRVLDTLRRGLGGVA